jgi:hypothetical protein
MPFKKNKEFDIVFSNSAIEHMGTYAQQREVAEEIKRVGKSFFIQTPNKYFPVEPHAVFPLFQFMPLWLRKMIVAHFHPGWYKKALDEKFDEHTISSVRLLTAMELNTLFSPCRIYKEKLFGLTKSLIALSER